MKLFALLILLPAVVLSQDNIDQVKAKLISALDANKDGKVSKQETENYFLSFDTDKSGEVSLAEFKVGADKIDPIFVGHEDTLFDVFDADGSGGISKEDIDHVFDMGDFDQNEFLERFEIELIASLAATIVIG